MTPRDALGAFTEQLDRRFRDFDASMRTKLIDCMHHEDKLLTQHIEKHRLTEWLRTALEAAQAQHDKEKQEAPNAIAPLTLGGPLIDGNTTASGTNGKAL
jgi:nuclear pore complex protein Nup133